MCVEMASTYTSLSDIRTCANSLTGHYSWTLLMDSREIQLGLFGKNVNAP